MVIIIQVFLENTYLYVLQCGEHVPRKSNCSIATDSCIQNLEKHQKNSEDTLTKDLIENDPNKDGANSYARLLGSEYPGRPGVIDR